MPQTDQRHVILMAGAPAHNHALYHRIRFDAPDPAVLIVGTDGRRLLIVRDIEMQRARRQARADRVACPADFVPDGELSGDRETATAQAAAEALRRTATRRVMADRTLPLSFAAAVRAVGIDVVYDPDLGVADRRAKDDQEVEALREAQLITHQAVRLACEMIGGATADAQGALQHQGEPLTSESVRAAIDIFLLLHGMVHGQCIVAGGPQGADCHHPGSGPLRTGEPIIVDVFPRSKATRYHGDCTRTVVHGEAPEDVVRMHAAVLAAGQAAEAATRPGVTGGQVHAAATAAIERDGFGTGMPPADAPASWAGMVHGTGHGIGLEVHEPPLLDRGGPELIEGDVLTIEPGLYSQAIGGVRVEDMVVVRQHDCELFGGLPTGLAWA